MRWLTVNPVRAFIYIYGTTLGGSRLFMRLYFIYTERKELFNVYFNNAVFCRVELSISQTFNIYIFRAVTIHFVMFKFQNVIVILF